VQLSPDYSLAASLGLAYARAANTTSNQLLKKGDGSRPNNFAAAFNLGLAYLQKQMVLKRLQHSGIARHPPDMGCAS